MLWDVVVNEQQIFFLFCFFFFNDTATTEIYTLSLHDALPIWVFLLGHIYDSYIRNQIATVMKENPSASMEQIGVLCSIILGAKSKELVAAESENLTRKEGESVSSFQIGRAHV